MPSVAEQFVVAVEGNRYHVAGLRTPTRFLQKATRFDTHDVARDAARKVDGIVTPYSSYETTNERLERLASQSQDEVFFLERAIKIKKAAAKAGKALADLHNLGVRTGENAELLVILDTPLDRV